MKKILILGINSYVGFYLAEKLRSSHEIFGVSRKEIPELKDINLLIENSLNLESVSQFIKSNSIEIVINCICLGNVDLCEKEKEITYTVNYLQVENLVKLSKQLHFKLIHFSSNAVYCGDKPLYSENSLKEPKNYYGLAKAMGDDYIRTNLDNYLLIRVMTLYGDKKDFHRNNPGAMIIGAIAGNKPIQLVNDLYGNLLFIDDLINFLEIAIRDNLVGEFNISGDQIVNRFELGLLICEVMEKPLSLITSCSSDIFPSIAKRANNTSFDNTKIKNIKGVHITPLKESIIKIMKRIKNGSN